MNALTIDAPSIEAVLAALLVATVGARLLAAAHRRATRRLRQIDGPTREVWFIELARRSVDRARSLLAHRTRRGPGADAVAEWCDDLGRRVRAGATLRDALLTTNPRAPALVAVVAPVQLRLERGDTVGLALGTPGDEGHFDLARNVISTAAQLGGPSAHALDRVAAALRLRSADQQERAAHSAQARMSAHVLTLVPLGFLALVLSIDGGVRGAVGTPLGAAIVVAGLALNAAGWLWMRAVIASAP